MTPIIEKEPTVSNEVTRRTETAICAGRFTRMNTDNDNESKHRLKAKEMAFRESIEYALGDGWFELNAIGRLKHERR